MMLQVMLLAVLVPLLVTLTVTPCSSESNLILLDDTVGLGRTFDGIGGLSGGSVSTMYIDIIIIIIIMNILGA